MKAGTRQRAMVCGTGAASVALRGVLEAPRCHGRVLAAFPAGAYIELRGDEEPRVLAVLRGDAIRLPNAVVLGRQATSVVAPRPGDEVTAGEGVVDFGGQVIRVRRWWDPLPALPRLDAATLAAGTEALAETCRARRHGLEGFPAVQELAMACLTGDLLTAITTAERLVGLGPGLTPSGDDLLAGLLVALRLMGRALANDQAIYLADWLGAAVTYDARTRTTPLSATLLHCAAAGQACAEANAVLHAIAEGRPVQAPGRRLLSAGHTSGADLAWGLLTGCRAVLAGAEG